MAEPRFDDGVPVPEFRRGAPRPPVSKYGFHDMLAGQSVFIAGKTANDLQGTTRHWARKLGATFTARTREEGGVRGVRIWRVT